MFFWLFLKKFDWNMSVYKKISSFSFWFFSFLVFRPSNGFVIKSQKYATREEVVESGNLTYGIRTYSFWPFDFNQGYFNQFEVLESQKWPLVDKIKSFYIKSALSFSDFQLLYGQKTVYSLQPLLFLEIIALNLWLCISFSVNTGCVLYLDPLSFRHPWLGLASLASLRTTSWGS